MCTVLTVHETWRKDMCVVIGILQEEHSSLSVIKWNLRRRARSQHNHSMCMSVIMLALNNVCENNTSVYETSSSTRGALVASPCIWQISAIWKTVPLYWDVIRRTTDITRHYQNKILEWLTWKCEWRASTITNTGWILGNQVLLS